MNWEGLQQNGKLEMISKDRIKKTEVKTLRSLYMLKVYKLLFPSTNDASHDTKCYYPITCIYKDILRTFAFK